MRTFSNSFKISCTTPSANFLIADKLKIVAGVFDTTGLTLTDIIVDTVSVWMTGKNCPADNEFHIIELIGSGSISYIGVDDPDTPTDWYPGALRWFSCDDDVTTLDQHKITFQLPDNGVAGRDILTAGTGTMDTSTEWQLSNTTISAGEMHFDANNDYSKLLDATYDALMPTGKIFQIQLEVTEYTKSGDYAQLQVKDGDSTGNYVQFYSLGVQTVIVQLINPNAIFRLSTNGGSCSIDNLIIQPWTNAVAFKNITTDAYVGEIPPINPPVEPPVGGLKYPLVAKLIMSNKEYQDPTLQAAIAKHDLIEIGFYRNWYKTMSIAQAVDEIHTRGLTNKNGKVMLFQYTNVMEMQSHTLGEAKYDIYLEVNTKNYWLRNADTGGKLLDGNSWEINMGSDMHPNWEYQTWLANRHRSVLFTDENNFDGWYIDNAFRRTRQEGEPADWSNDGVNDTDPAEEDSYGSDKFREGTAAFVAKIRDLGLSIPIMANYDRGPDYPHYRNLTEGGLLEWADKHVASMGWEYFMKEQYYASMELTLPPHYVIWDAMHYATDTDYKDMRYGLCSVLMHNGYYCSSANDSYSTIFWFDEYDLDIGEPHGGHCYKDISDSVKIRNSWMSLAEDPSNPDFDRINDRPLLSLHSTQKVVLFNNDFYNYYDTTTAPSGWEGTPTTVLFQNRNMPSAIGMYKPSYFNYPAMRTNTLNEREKEGYDCWENWSGNDVYSGAWQSTKNPEFHGTINAANTYSTDGAKDNVTPNTNPAPTTAPFWDTLGTLSSVVSDKAFGKFLSFNRFHTIATATPNSNKTAVTSRTSAPTSYVTSGTSLGKDFLPVPTNWKERTWLHHANNTFDEEFASAVAYEYDFEEPARIRYPYSVDEVAATGNNYTDHGGDIVDGVGTNIILPAGFKI